MFSTSLGSVLSLIFKVGDKLHIEQYRHFYKEALYTLRYLTSLRRVLYLIIRDGNYLLIEQFRYFYREALQMVS